MTLSYIVAGFGVGILVGLTGVGGGSLMTPILTLFFNVVPGVAVGTDLAFASITKVAGTVAHRYRGTVHWSIVRLLCIGALPAAVIAALFLKQFGALSPNIGQFIRYSIAGSVALTVIALLFRGRMQAWLTAHPEKHLQGASLATATVLSGISWEHWLLCRRSALALSVQHCWCCCIQSSLRRKLQEPTSLTLYR